MEPIIIVGLASKVVDTLIPYVKKGAEQFTKEFGKAACEKVEILARTLKERFSGDKTFTEMLNEFEKDPEDNKSVLEKILQKKVEQDKDLASELAKHLKDLGPTLKVDMCMKEGKRVTGVKAKKMTEGTIEVNQKIGKAEDVNGANVEVIGRE